MIYVRSLVGYLGEIGRGERERLTSLLLCESLEAAQDAKPFTKLRNQERKKRTAAVNGVWMTREVLAL